MAKNEKLEIESANLLTVNSAAIDKAFKSAVKDALLKHKQANNPVAIWRGGKVVLLRADEIFSSKK